MADYGLSVTNDFGSIVISSTYKVLVFSERGTFGITSQYTNAEGYGAVTFVKPITTQEPPHIFVRILTGAHNSLGFFTVIAGGSGNWTGFNIVSAVRGGSILQNYTLEYVSCKYSDKPNTGTYGLEIRGSDGSIVYTSSDRVVKYNKFTKTWAYVQGAQVDTYTANNITIDVDDFTSISSIDRGVNWLTGGAEYAGLTIMSGGTRMVRITRQIPGGGLWFYQGTNGTCLAIPVCKFPIDRYYN